MLQSMSISLLVGIKVVEAAIDKAYDNYNGSELGKIETELERLANAFK